MVQDEQEKERLRELKRMTAALLRGVDLSRYEVLDRADVRLRAYVESVRSSPEGHNLYELLALKRFFVLLDRYEFRPSAVRRFVAVYESLRFNGMRGVVRYRLTPIQVFQFASILGFYRTREKRLCRTAVLYVPRKFSKTTSVAALAIDDLLFGDANAQAYVAANSYEQAQICFREIRGILKNMDSRMRRFRLNREKVFNLMPGKSSFVRCLASDADKLDGLNASLVIVDEYSQADSADLKNVLTSSMGARVNPLTVIITTASEKLNGPFYSELQGYKSILEGRMEDDSVFAHVFEPDIDDAEDSEATWRKVQPHWGITIQEDYYEHKYREALRSYADMKAFRTKLLNVYVVDDARAWISAEEAMACRRALDLDGVGGGPMTMVALDLSVHDDFSAVSYTVYSETLRSFHVHTDYYLPRGTLESHPNRELYRRWAESGYLRLCDGDVIDYRMIVDDVLRRSRRLRIVGIGYDAYKSQECVNMLSAAGFRPVLGAVPQNYGAFTSPVESFEYALRTGHVTLNDNPINWYCFGNAVLDEDRNENKKPVKISDNRKIDGVITALMTFYMYTNYERPVGR